MKFTVSSLIAGAHGDYLAKSTRMHSEYSILIVKKPVGASASQEGDPIPAHLAQWSSGNAILIVGAVVTLNMNIGQVERGQGPLPDLHITDLILPVQLPVQFGSGAV
jgi:hypothetical protein